MKTQRYTELKSFRDDVMEILLENEVQNNLPIGFIRNEGNVDISDWLLFTVKDDNGSVLLTAACTPPHNMILYETGNKAYNEAIAELSGALKSSGLAFPGVMAEIGLAERFATVYSKGYITEKTMNIMRLDKVADISGASGKCRPLRDEDMFFAPYWDRAFGEDCNTYVYDIPRHVEKIKSRLNRNIHYIWEDPHPVSQAVHGRSTENGAVVNGVYTPPQYRRKGYGTSVVAELSRMLLEEGHKFCCLFADAANPVSNSIYRKIGYRDVCVYAELHFSVQ